MNRRSLFALCLGAILFFSLAVLASGAEKKKAPPKEQRISGTVQMINKDTSVITVRKGSVQRMVVYNAATKYTKVNKPGAMEDVKEGRRVICLGLMDDKARLVANRIDVRDAK